MSYLGIPLIRRDQMELFVCAYPYQDDESCDIFWVSSCLCGMSYWGTPLIYRDHPEFVGLLKQSPLRG